jgi:four helix bundle protein
MTNDEIEDAFWNDGNESRVVCEEPTPAPRSVYDLEERTARFGEAVIDFANIIPRTAVTRRLIEQLVGCGASVGANYCEADDAVSKKEFRLRCGTCKKEARETKYFLRMVVRAVPELKPEARPLWQEAKETPPDLRQNLAERRMNRTLSSLVIRQSSFL